MGKGFKSGAGGGNPLNFKVIDGTTEPANPKKNWIWVNTDKKITGHYFSATQPENMAEGEVWFSVGASSPVAFNALKKNDIQVYPLSAKQFVSGALVDKTAKTYDGEKWVDWVRFLYNNGDECTDITGGWETISKPFAYEADNAEIHKTKEAVDLTGFNTLRFEGVIHNDDVSGYPTWVTLNVWSSFDGYARDNIVAEFAGETNDFVEIDISALSGKFFVGYMIYSETSSGKYVEMDRLYLMNRNAEQILAEYEAMVDELYAEVTS